MTFPAAEPMPGRQAKRPHLLDRLGVRQALLLSATLLPLGVVLLVQIAAVEREAEARTRSALTGATLAAGSRVLGRIEEARGAAQALATLVPALAADAQACGGLMRGYVERMQGRVVFAGFLPAVGAAACASADAFPPIVLASGDDAEQSPWLAVGSTGEGQAATAVVVTAPVRDAAERRLGTVVLSLPYRDFLGPGDRAGETRPIALIVFDAEGRIVTGSGGLEDAARRVPADRALKALTVAEPVAFGAVSATGIPRVYSVVPIVDGSLFLMGTWREQDIGKTARLGGLPPVVFTTLMWIACLGTAILGAERLVSRHIRALGRSMSAFAAGDRRVALPDLRHAPAEMQAVGRAYARLTESIVRDEAELENAVHHKEVLLREVHHRVKNNLQLIASIMNLQMRKTRSPEARSLLRGLQDRVMSLATIHKELYQTSGEAEIRADELLADITRQVLKLATGAVRRFEVSTDLEPLTLTPDQAVPLALLVTEALTNAIKYAGAVEDRPSRLAVTLRGSAAGEVRLEVVNTLPRAAAGQDEGDADSTGLGSQLLAAFAQQVGGTLQTEATQDDYTLRLDFVVQSAAPAVEEQEEAAPADAADRSEDAPQEREAGA